MAIPMGRESMPSGLHFGRTGSRVGAIWMLCLITALLLVGLLGFDLWRSYHDLEEQGYRETRSLEGVYESHVLADVHAVDEMLAVFAEQVKQRDAGSAARLRRGPDGYDATVLAQVERDAHLLMQSLPTGGLALLDRDGTVIASTVMPRGLALGARDFVTGALTVDHPTETYFGRAMIGPVNGQLLVPISRPVYREDGTLIGIAAASLFPSAFVAPFESMDAHGSGTVTIAQTDGLVIARAPGGAFLVGRSIVDGEVFRDRLSHSSEGSVRIKGSIVGTDLFVTYKALPGTPFVVLAALGTDVLLGRWDRMLVTYLLLGSVAVLAIGSCGWLLARDQRRREAIAMAGRTRTLIDGMSSFVVLFSSEGTILEVNEGWLQKGMLARDMVIGRRFWETGWCAYSDQMARRVRALVERARAGEKLREDLVFRIGPDSYCTLDFTLQPVIQPDGTRSIIGSGFDVTDQRQLETKLRSSQKMEALGLLAGGIAHDFNNLLAAMSQFSQFLVEDLEAGSPQHGFADRLRRCCAQGKDIVAQILTYARPDAVQRSALDVGLLARDVIETVSSSCPPTVLFETAVPEQSLTVVANAAQMTQILLNLCVNAIDAVDPDARKREPSEPMPAQPGEPRGVLRLALAVASPGDRRHPLRPRGIAEPAAHYLSGTPAAGRRYARLSVHDTGSGMSQEVLQRIFDPFFTTKTRGRGTGLGLAVVHSIVNSLGGLVEVESTPGEGSIFAIYLPLAEAAPERASDRIEAQLPPAGRERILLVEDDAEVAESIRTGLLRAGYAVTVAGDAAQALATLRRQPEAWDLVISDQNLPDCDGRDLIAELRRLRPGLPAILHTGSAELGADELAAAEAFDGLLRKPAEPAAISAMIRSILARRRAGAARQADAAVAG